MANSVLPAPLSIAAFQDDVRLSWLLQHYQHRPVLRDVISISASNRLGEAGMAAAKVMSTTLFAQFYKLLPSGATSTLQTPFHKEYGRAIQALRKQVLSFQSECLEATLVPALLLFLTEVRMHSYFEEGRS